MVPDAPAPDMVAASRRHLTDRYASGVDRLLWDSDKRLLEDRQAIAAVIEAAQAREAEALDLAAALVLAQAARLDLDWLEYELFEQALGSGMGPEAIAAVLELPDAGSAEARHRWLQSRWQLPRAQNPAVSGRDGRTAVPARQAEAGRAADRARRRAEAAAARAAQAARRREQLGATAPEPAGASRHRAEHASASAGEARVLAGEATERVALGLLRAATALDRCATATAELAAERDDAALQQKATEYAQTAARYRGLAAGYRDIGRGVMSPRPREAGR